MKTKRTYISINQIKRYGFIINNRRQTDLEAFILTDNMTIRLFNYDYTVRPNKVIMIDINGNRVYEGCCTNSQRFRK